MEKLMCEVVEHTCMNLENRLRRAGMRPGLVGLVRSKMVDAHLVDLQKAMEGLKQMDGRTVKASGLPGLEKTVIEFAAGIVGEKIVGDDGVMDPEILQMML